MSDLESNPKLDWRDSLRRHAFEEALARQRALGLVGQSEAEVLTALERLVDCQQAIRSGDYSAARKAVHPGWTALEPSLASSAQAIESRTSANSVRAPAGCLDFISTTSQGSTSEKRNRI